MTAARALSPNAEPVARAGRDREHVLDGAADLHADRIGARRRCGSSARASATGSCAPSVMPSDATDDVGRETARDLFGEARPGEKREALAELRRGLLEHLRHELQAALLDALGRDHHDASPHRARGATFVATERKCDDGGTRITISAPADRRRDVRGRAQRTRATADPEGRSSCCDGWRSRRPPRPRAPTRRPRARDGRRARRGPSPTLPAPTTASRHAASLTRPVREPSCPRRAIARPARAYDARRSHG